MQIKNPTKIKATLLGLLAIFMWSLTGLQVVSVSHIPVFQLISMGLGTAFIFGLIFIIRLQTVKDLIQVPMPMLLAGIAGICITSSTFFAAVQYAPPERVVLINYLWPFVIVLFAPYILSKRFHWTNFFGVLCAFFGIYLLLTDGRGIHGFEWQYWKGYIMALIGAFSWGVYVLYSRKYHHITSAIISVFLGLAAVTAFVLHLCFEHFVMPTVLDALIILSIGLTSQGLSYITWNFAIKNGYYFLLCTLTYLTPIFSIILLSIFGHSQFTETLVMAILMVLVGTFMVSDYFANLLARLKLLISR